MPGLDGTGPAGEGSRTGRRQGKCDDDKTLESRRRGLGRRFRFQTGEDQEHHNIFGLHRGKGRGFGIRKGQGNRNRGTQK